MSEERKNAEAMKNAVAAAATIGAALARVAARGLVPLAEVYAPPPKAQKDAAAAREAKLAAEKAREAGQLTAEEKTSLVRAGHKLVVEAGTLLMANFPPAPEWKTTAVKEGKDGELPPPSLAMAVSAVRGVLALQESVAKKRAEAEQQRTEAEREEMLRPVTVQALRARRTRRG